ncbi:MAG: diguanylate cyclase domain-containing protein, partial [Acidimicrobiales bacterium]
MEGALAGAQLRQRRPDTPSGLDRSGAPLLYLGGDGDPAASSAQAQIATIGPFAVYWVSTVDALSSHVFFTPVQLVLLHPDVAAPVAVDALAAAAVDAPVVRIGAQLPGDVDAGIGSVPARAGLVESVRYELMVDELDRRASPGATGPVPSNEGEGLFEWDLRTDHVAYSDRWESICGPSSSYADSGPDRWFAGVDSADLPLLLEAIETHLAGDSPVLEAVYRMAGDGAGRRVRAVAVRDETGEAIRLSGFVTVVEEPEVVSDDRYDALTGLLDRASFLTHLEHAVGPTIASTAAVLVVGIDRFSWVNDSYGHAVGDQLLAAMGRRLVDTVRPDDIVARLGGDEFAVLLTGLRERHGAGAAAERVLAATLRRLQLGDIE